MAMTVTTNVSAMNTSRWLNTNQAGMESSLAKLSSGYRINTAADGPADLVISEQLRAQLSGLNRSIRNTEEASNVVGIAEGALNEVNEILNTMTELALHAANSGITSSDQIIADQAEMDSAVQTIDRIAKTTKYSDTYLLNGTQSISYDTVTDVDSTEDNALLDTNATRIDQITSLEDDIHILFTGEDSNGDAMTENYAEKACIEAVSGSGVDMDDTTITADVVMSITGSNGTQTYSFGEGDYIGTVADTINADADDTGVGAQLIFDNDVTGVDQSTAYTAAASTAHTSGVITAYELDKDFKQDTDYTIGSASVTGTIEIGANTDGDGCVYVKFGDNDSYTVYKDADMTMAVSSGTLGTGSSIELNDSGLTFSIDATAAADPEAGDIAVLQIGAATEVSTAGTTAGFTTNSDDIGLEATVLTGVRLGENTDINGNIYTKVDVNTTDGTVTVNLYNDSTMSDNSLMATSGAIDASSLTALSGIEVYAETSNGGNSSTGLYGTINIDFDSATGIDASAEGTYTATMSASDLGIRLYSTDYGDDAEVTVEMEQGALFSDADGNVVDDSITDYGQDATVNINGSKVELDGMTAIVATTDLNATFVFDEGELGMTTVAVQGYDQGALSSKAGATTDEDNHATQCISTTSETLTDLSGGMNLQVGEGTNSYESTVLGISSMAADDLGSTSFYDDFDGDGIYEEKTLSLTDLQSSGYASLAVDPEKAMTIIDQAVNDVAMARARLGAVQSNLLQTNINSLNVAVENITATESAIRDTDMATESTEYTKNQILVQAATSMLAQANSLPQQALSLLG